MKLKCRDCQYEKEDKNYQMKESTKIELNMLKHIHQVTFKHTVDLIE